MNNGYYPYSIQRDPAISFKLDTEGQTLKYKEDEKHQKAPEILPFEFNSVISVLGNTFVSLTELRKMLDQAKGSELINQAGVEAIQEKIDNINQTLLEISDDLAIIAI
jgi:hypothetical protein